jgi:hypothetical protein
MTWKTMTERGEIPSLTEHVFPHPSLTEHVFPHSRYALHLQGFLMVKK